MKVAIVGSRNYPHPWLVASFVYALEPDTVIVSGGAHGPDSWAAHCAEVFGLPEPIIYRADWKKYGRSAGYIRNSLIVAACDSLVAFWDGESRGTFHSINLARRAGKPVKVIDLTGI
jgi:predicted Rossmann fold nucleotide-binding protein DprA/Smf involved in DNA uptake